VKKAFLIVAAAALWSAPAHADANADTLREILALERQAMDGWRTGNPDPVLAAADPGITYFHAATDKRLDGLAAVKSLYEKFRGIPLFDSYEILDPQVQIAGPVAVLTYRFVRHNGAAASDWNATQVYERKKEGWRVIHAHWSMARQAQP
jgi:Calcium/calmodulin dependent protein kinase II association domain